VSARSHARVEIRRRVHGRVDLAAKRPLRIGENIDHLAEPYLANHEEVDVALVPEFTSRGRSIDERHVDTISNRAQCVAQHVDKSGGFGKQRLQLRKDR
jgi:hypothetical protein